MTVNLEAWRMAQRLGEVLGEHIPVELLISDQLTEEIWDKLLERVRNVAQPREPPEPQDQQRIEAARRLYASDGEIEIDDNAKISHGMEAGAYVEAWVWVGDDQLGGA